MISVATLYNFNWLNILLDFYGPIPLRYILAQLDILDF